MNVEKIILKNGLRIIYVQQPASFTATALILVEAGSEYETKEINGLSHFLEHLTFKGTTRRPELGRIAEELDSLGAEFNAFTGKEDTGYYAKAESHKLPQILDLISDLYLNPIFDPKEIEKERGVIVEEINLDQDTPTRYIHDLFSSLLYGDQPAGWNITGPKETVKTLAKNDFIAYRNNHYIAPATVVIVAGNFKREDVHSYIESQFGSLPEKPRVVKAKTFDTQTESRVLLQFRESDQTHLVLGVRGYDVFHEKRQVLQVLADILAGGMSSRLWKRVREEMGAAYYIAGGTESLLDHGYMAIWTGADHQKVSAVIKVILEEFAHLKKELVSPGELTRAKDHIVGNFILNLETSDQLAGFYGGQEILTRRILQPEELIAKIQKVRAEEVQSVALEIFHKSKLNLAMIGPQKDESSIRRLLDEFEA